MVKSIYWNLPGSRAFSLSFSVWKGPTLSEVGLLFYNTLIDENAANHVALGRARKFNLENGEAMSDDDFAEFGGNLSLIHIDFMIGSDKMDVNGITEDGTVEPIMRKGEWAFEV